MAILQTLTSISHLECSSCHQWYDAYQLQTFAGCCNKPLLVKFNTGIDISKSVLKNRPMTMWRYREMLPVFEEQNIVSLNEGMTPIVTLHRLADKYNLRKLLMKDESRNPTGSFKARGISVAISKAKELGINTCMIATAGNAGGAMAAYCAAAGMKAIVIMPSHTPKIFKDECESYGADLILVKGLISDCSKKLAEIKHEIQGFDLSTLKEPYRIEGKKTMGYEIAEQLNWKLPDVIFYPTGGGTGMIGIWKAFHEMVELGWIENKLPRIIAVQSEKCQPIVETWIGNQPNSKNYVGSPSLANGLAVPHPFGEDLILDVLNQSGGVPFAVSDEDMIASVKEIAREEGLLIAPEGAALLTAIKKLLNSNFINASESILMLNTGTGYKYLENIL